MRNTRTSGFAGLFWGTVFLIAMLVVIGVTDVGAIEIVAKGQQRNSLEIQGSFNYARRDIFRDIYGNGVTFAVRYEHALGDKMGWGVRVSRVQLSDYEDYSLVKLKYVDFAVVPMMTYSLVKTGGFRLFLAPGVGLSFRSITLDSYRLDQDGYPAYPYEAKQRETTLYGLLMLGADLKLAGKWFLGTRVAYDRHFFGDVTTGALGDTGGFNFGGSLGIRF